MGTLFDFSFSDWKMGEWIPVFLTLVVVVAIAVVVWLESFARSAQMVCACAAFVLCVAAIMVVAAQSNVEERQQKQQDKVANRARELELEAQQAYADLAKQGFADGFNKPTALSVLENSVTFTYPNCVMRLGLRKFTDEYFVILFPTDAVRPITPSVLPEVINLGCMQP